MERISSAHAGNTVSDCKLLNPFCHAFYYPRIGISKGTRRTLLPLFSPQLLYSSQFRARTNQGSYHLNLDLTGRQFRQILFDNNSLPMTI